MQPDESTNNPGGAPDGGPGPGATAVTPGAGVRPRRMLWPWALGAGLLAGLVSWYGGERAFGHFQPVMTRPPNWSKLNYYERQNIDAAIHRVARRSSEARNAAVAFGLLGATLGGALGLFGGLARGAIGPALMAAVVGVVVGGGAGAGTSYLLTPVFMTHLDPDAPSHVPLLSRGAILLAVGAAGGLAFGLGVGGRRAWARALLGGLAGALLGTLVFEMGSSTLFPLVRHDQPIPGVQEQSLVRLLVHLSVAVCAALGAALVVHEGRSAASAAKPSPPLDITGVEPA